MLLMPKDKKRVASIIVADMSPSYVGKDKGGYDKKMDMDKLGEESECDEGLEACAAEIIRCVKAGDAEKLAIVLKDAVDMCQGDMEVY